MRWGSQQVLSDGVGSDAVLPGMRGLLRTVRVPEFAGMVFHEVEAKSALNRVPGGPLPFEWTVNPYRGCSHACTYCLSGDTRVLLADGRTRALAELRVGDEVYGTSGRGGRRRYVRTTVLAHWSTMKPAYRLVLADGSCVISSGDHRFLTERGWRHVVAGEHRQGMGSWVARPHLTVGDRLCGIGQLSAHPVDDDSYRRGYLCGIARTAGRGGVFSDGNPPGGGVGPARSHVVALEVARRTRRYLASYGMRVGGLAEAAGAPSYAPAGWVEMSEACLARVADVGSLGEWPVAPDESWCRGFLAAVFDAAGRCSDEGDAHIAHPDGKVVRWAAEALRRLGFSAATQPRRVRDAQSVRLLGGQLARMRFCHAVDSAVTRKRGMLGERVIGNPQLDVVAVEPLGRTVPMFDITTGTGDFIAEGVVSHNCFARNTHTYLDFDSGEDFNRQVVVKVNVARVLERELRSPRWGREHVAMGTNTDPYQRAEGRYRLMPGVISALARSGTPFSVLTKGTLLARDLPLLASASADVRIGLGVSIALLDRELQSSLEPGTPSPAARLELVRRIADAGFACGVMVAPVLPMLTDSVEALDELLGRIAAAGASGATVIALHLRPGTREWFLGWLARQHPALLEPYRRLYARGAYVDRRYREALAGRVTPLLRRHGLARPAAARILTPDPTSRTSPGADSARPIESSAGEQLALM